MKRRHWLPLLVALLVAAALVGWRALRWAPPPQTRPEVEFPYHPRPHERARAEQRRTLQVAAAEDAGTAESPVRRDPLLAALPGEFEAWAMVAELNALRHSPLGPRLVECLESLGDGDFLAGFRTIGIDLTRDVDRLAVVDHTYLVTGHFSDVDPRELLGDTARPYGEKGTVLSPSPVAELTLGFWDGQIIVFAETEQEVLAALDRLEGRGLHAPSALDESRAYGDLYGHLAPGGLAAFLPETRGPLGERIRATSLRAEVHVDVQDGVGIVARVRGPDPAQLAELARVMATTVDEARSGARAKGLTREADLLDAYRLRPGEAGFTLEVALPPEVVDRMFAGCARRRTP